MDDGPVEYWINDSADPAEWSNTVRDLHRLATRPCGCDDDEIVITLDYTRRVFGEEQEI